MGPSPSSGTPFLRLSGPAWFAIALMLLGLLAFAATAYAGYRSLKDVLDAAAARAHALETQLLAERTLSLLVDLETGQRGFIITGQEEFLEPYDAARLRLQATYSRLLAHLSDPAAAGSSGATGDMADQPQLDALIEQRLAYLEDNIDRRRFAGPEAVLNLSSYADGKRTMDRLRGEFALLVARQQALIHQRDADVRVVQARAARLTLALPAVGSVMILLAMALLIHERRQRNRAEQALRASNATLEQRVERRTAELHAAVARIQSFASELDRSIEAERRRLAREVHDQFGQIATALKMYVIGLRRVDPPLAEHRVIQLIEMVDSAIVLARRIASTLRPPLLDDLGLAAALEHFARETERASGLQVDVDVRDDARLSADQANQLFRIVQEAVTNTLRHAHASAVRVHAACEDDRFVLQVVDDGRGPGEVRPDAAGLRNMRERAVLAGGELQFGPAPRCGTLVRVMLPCLPAAQPAAAGDAEPPAQAAAPNLPPAVEESRP